MDRSGLAARKKHASHPIPHSASGRIDGARPLHVVHVISGDLWAGAEVQLYNLACASERDRDLRLSAVLFNEGLLAQRLRERDVQVRVLDESRMSAPALLRETVRCLKEWRADIVHTHRVKENVVGSIAARLAGARSLRTVHGHDEHPPGARQFRRRLARFVDRACARHVQDRIVAVSDDLRARLCARFPEAKISVVENGVDFARLRREADRRIALPGRDGRLKIALAGRLVPVKRIDIFLSVAHTLAQRLPGVFNFYLLGDGPLREQTRAHIQRLGLADEVFLLGFRDPVAPYLARMDMLFITSDHEGLPMNLLEALGLRVPVVAHAVGAVPRVLDHGRGGTLVYGQDPSAYAAVAERYVSAPAGFLAKAQQGWQSSKRYSAAASKSAYLDLYRALVSPHSTKQS